MPIAIRAYRLALLLLLVLSLPLAARADDASHRAKAEEIMTLLNTQRMVKQISDSVAKQVANAADKVADANPSADTKVKVADFQKQAKQLIDAQLSWDSVRAGFIDVYIKNFTEQEMDGIIAFYKTPAGAALLEKMPNVNSQIAQFGSTRMSTLEPQLKQQFEAFRKSAATEPLTPAAPPTLGAPAAPATSAPKPSTPK